MHRLYECLCGGENYDGARPCNFDWVKHLREECEKYNVCYNFGDKIPKNKLYMPLSEN